MIDNVNISFEFFPPKTPETCLALSQVTEALSLYAPRFFSVTCGAGGSLHQGTKETVALLQQKTGAMISPHLSGVNCETETLHQLLHHYQSMGIKQLVVLRGDRSRNHIQEKKIKYACDLVKMIRDITGNFFYIQVAAYPEMHPEAISPEADILNLKKKYEAGANSAITQYFYNVDAYFYFRDACEKQHIPIPIIPGVMPITQFSKLAAFSAACGAEIPRWILTRLQSYGDDLDSIKQFGLEVSYRLCQQLITGGVTDLHFYTLNKAEASIAILNQLGFKPGLVQKTGQLSLMHPLMA